MKIKIFKEDIHFSAAHFTIFSATERERIHGHNYFITAELTADMQQEVGLIVDYKKIKTALRSLCKELDEFFLLPMYSPYLNIQHVENQIIIRFHDDIISLPAKDVKMLPLTNITSEELCNWFLTNIKATVNDVKAMNLTISILSGPGQAVESSMTLAMHSSTII